MPAPLSMRSLRTLVITGLAVTFLPLALRQGTRTLFSFQGTLGIFLQRDEKVETTGAQAEKRLTTGSNPWLASDVSEDQTGLVICAYPSRGCTIEASETRRTPDQKEGAKEWLR